MLWFLLAACPQPRVYECAIQSDPDVDTVPVLTHDAGANVQIMYGPPGDMSFATPYPSESPVPLFGLAAGTEFAYEAYDVDGAILCSGTGTNGSPPSGYPDVTITVDSGERSPERWVIGWIFQFMGNQARAIAIDRETGATVWYRVEDDVEGRIGIDLQFVAGTNDIVYNLFDGGFADPVGLLRRRTLMGDLVQEWGVENFHHMFAQLPDGGFATQTLEIREGTNGDGEPVDLIGDTITEVAPDGTQSVVFNIWDWLAPVETHHWNELSIYPDGIDWTHGNAIKYDAATNRYLLSLGHANVLVDIDRTTGEPVEMFGEAGIPVAEGSTAFDYQHDPTWQPDGHLTMFTHSLATDKSGAIEYERVGDELVEVWSHDLDDGDLSAAALGQVFRLVNGNTLINYGAAGALREVTPEGTVVWEAVPSNGLGFAQVRVFSDWWEPE